MLPEIDVDVGQGSEVDQTAAAVMAEFNIAPSKQQAQEPAQDKPSETADKTDDKAQASAAKAAAALDDAAEYEIDGNRMTGAELRKGIMMHADYTRKTQEIAKQRETITGLQEWLGDIKGHDQAKAILKAVTEKILYAPDAESAKTLAGKLISALEGKQQEAAEAKEQDDPAQDFLRDMPEDDPYAQALRQLNKMYKQLSASTKSAVAAPPQPKKTTEIFDERTQAQRNPQADAEHVAQVKTVMTTTLDGVAKELNIDADDVEDWKSRIVFAAHKTFPKEFNSEQEFTSALKQLAKAEHQRLVQRDERLIARYHKSKQASLPGGATPAGANADASPKKITIDTFDEAFEQELNRVVAAREERERKK